MKTTIAITMACLATACQMPTKEGSYATLPMSDFARQIEAKRDDVEGYAFASSKSVTRWLGQELVPFVYAVERAGAIRVAIHFRTLAGDWVYPDKGFIGTPSLTPPLDMIDSEVKCGRHTCDHWERGRLLLSADDVRALVDDAQGENIQIRIVGRTGARLDGIIRKAEIIATLKALEGLY